MKTWQKGGAILAAFGLAILIYHLVPAGWPVGSASVAAIASLMAVFWSFEILPLYVTSLLGVLALSLGVPATAEFTPFPTLALEWGNPVVLLFLGSFLIAGAMKRHGVDRFLAGRLLSPYGQRPLSLLFRVGMGAVILSMWISNTASTAILLGIVTGIAALMGNEPRFKKGLILTVPLAANIGGIGTPVGTPPNAIALGLLRAQGFEMSFLEWMVMGVPLMLLLLGVLIAILYLAFPPNQPNNRIKVPPALPLSFSGKAVLGMTGLTGIVLMSSAFLGVPESLVVLFTGALFLAFGLMGKEDVKALPWDVLILLWGGLSLGVSVEKSGLGESLVSAFVPVGHAQAAVILIVTITWIFSFFISNTAAISLMLPLALTLPHANIPELAITLAITASVAMLLPVSTPPNMQAFSTGEIHVGDLLRVTVWLVPIGLLLALLGYFWILPFYLS